MIGSLRSISQSVRQRVTQFLLEQLARRLDKTPDNLLDSIPRARPSTAEARSLPISIRKKLEIDPGNLGAWCSLGYALLDIDQVDEAVTCFQRALAIDPVCNQALNGLANATKLRGELGKAIELYRQALAVCPSDLLAFQNLLYALLCSNEASEEEILRWHKRFAEQFETPRREFHFSHPNLPEEGRILRIGYVSPDFRDHVAGRCIAPVIARHDRGRFEIYCYYNGGADDDFTESIRNSCDHWRNIADLEDELFCAQVRSDGIDILVDLSGHTPGNRMLAFARKPAPVQVTYLDYSATTGLSSMDYRVTDRVCDPENIADAFYTETLVRSQEVYWLYNPPVLGGPISGRKDRKGRLYLACVNSFYRINDSLVRTWAEILHRLPNAQLILVGVPAGAAQASIAGRFNASGIASERLELFGFLDYANYLRLIRAVDIALAPFPYNGAMSMLDCLWNGTPVVSWRGGKTFRSRMGASILGVLELDEFIAADEGQYIDIVVRLAADTKRRRILRGNLRDRIRNSALCDAYSFTRSLEKAYAEMWSMYCRNVHPESRHGQ